MLGPGSRTRSSGNIWEKSERTFQPDWLVMQWTASRGGGGGWLAGWVHQRPGGGRGELEKAHS